MVKVRFILTFFWIILFDNLNAQIYPKSGSERLYQFAKMIGAPYTNLTDSVANNFDKLEDDLIRWASRNFTETEVEYYLTRFDSVRCRQKVRDEIWNFNQLSMIKSLFQYIGFKHKYFKPYNYKFSFRKRNAQGTSYYFFEYIDSNYPYVFNNLYQEQYDIQKKELLDKLKRVEVGDVIYVLGLIDSYKSISFLEKIIQDTLKYCKSDIEVAKLALARLGNTEYEESILKDTFCSCLTLMYRDKEPILIDSLKGGCNEFSNLFKFLSKYVYINTQQSVYKFTDFLRYRKDGHFTGGNAYTRYFCAGDTIKYTYRKFIFFRKTKILLPGTIGILNATYLSRRYAVLEYLLYALKDKYFYDISFLDGYVKEYCVEYPGGCAFSCCNLNHIDDYVEKMLQWLEDNKGNYKLNRRVLF